MFEGDSVHYWASPVEAKLCTDEDIILVGAGNSAGQAIVFLAPLVKRLTVLVRGTGLAASMSRYPDRSDQVAGQRFDPGPVRARRTARRRCRRPRSATVRNNATSTVARVPVRQIFLFVGAEPNTAWLDGTIALDDKGYILTGVGPADAQGTAPLPLQTSLPRVFAIGDVRSGSTKRVASAVGEGAAVVAQIHSMLGATATTA